MINFKDLDPEIADIVNRNFNELLDIKPIYSEISEPRLGDIVGWYNSKGNLLVGVYGEEITQGDAIVLMKYNEVKLRMSKKPTEQELDALRHRNIERAIDSQGIH